MSTIIAARYLTQSEVSVAIEALQESGFSAARISSFYVNPPGQHDRFPIGGDRDKSVGAEDTPTGVITGAAAGATVGLVASPAIGPLGPLVGAYVGSMMGGLASTREKHESADVDEDHPVEYHSGMLVAVALDGGAQQQSAIDALKATGGFDMEIAEGNIENGDWADFDPLQAPRLLRAKA